MTLRDYIEENREKIIDMKVNDCINPTNNFVYLSADGELRIGRNDEYGHNDQQSFVGHCDTHEEAAAELDNLVNRYEQYFPYELDKEVVI